MNLFIPTFLLFDRFSQNLGLLIFGKKHGAYIFIFIFILGKLIIVTGSSFLRVFTFFDSRFSLFYYQLHPVSCTDALVQHCCRDPGLMRTPDRVFHVYGEWLRSVSLSTQRVWCYLENNWICGIARYFLMAFHCIFKECMTGDVTLSHHSVKELDACIQILDLVWKLYCTECLNLKILLPNMQAK